MCVYTCVYIFVFTYIHIHTETYFIVSRISKDFVHQRYNWNQDFVRQLHVAEPMILKMTLGTPLHRFPQKHQTSQATVGFSENEVSILFCYWAACV